jgi:hypothetical protein
MQPTPPVPKDVVPVQADMETVCNHGTGPVTSSAKFFRDEKSRTRVEHGDMVSIDDPVKGESYVLDMPKKIAIPSAPKPALPAMPAAPAMPGMPKPPTAPAAPKPPQMQEIADLGEKMINGFKAQGKRYAMPPAPAMPGAPQMPGAPKVPGAPAAPGAPAVPAAPAVPGAPAMPGAPAAPAAPGMPQMPTSEVWTSPELKLPIQSSVIDPKTGAKCVTEMKNIKPGAKLDPGMFKVPPDFKIAPPPAPRVPPFKS